MLLSDVDNTRSVRIAVIDMGQAWQNSIFFKALSIF